MIDRREEPAFLFKCSRSFLPCFNVKVSKLLPTQASLLYRLVWHIFSSLLRTSLAKKKNCQTVDEDVSDAESERQLKLNKESN